VRRSPFVVLSRAFFARFFASESATSDEALRHAISRVHPPPGVVVRATAVRNINAEDLLEWTVAILVAYCLPGHARLKTRWPLYVVLLWALAFAPASAARHRLDDPAWIVGLAAALLLVALVLDCVGRTRAPRWSIDRSEERSDDSTSTSVLDIGFVLPGATRI